MRILIIGSGVAGTVAAIAAKKAGFDPVIYEAYERSAGLAHGVFLTVAVNGLDALRSLDAHHVVLDSGFPTAQVEFSSGTGKKLGAMPLGPTLSDGTVTQTIRRAALYDGLYQEAVLRGVRIEHGKQLVDLAETRDGKVRACFRDGSHAEGDLLIGADGVHSATRRLIDPNAPAPRYVGLGNTGGFTRAHHIGAKPGTYEMIWGKRCFFGYTVSPDGEIWWFANPPSRAEIPRARLTSLTTEQLRQQLIELLSVDDSPAAEIVRSTKEDFKLSNQYDLPGVPVWHKGRAVIIGDAAHAVSPSSGQGCSLACEDAVILVRCLRRLQNIPRALAAYEEHRRARVERVVAWGARMNNTKLAGPVRRLLRDLVLPKILKKVGSPEQMDSMAWLFKHHIEWGEAGGNDGAQLSGSGSLG